MQGFEFENSGARPRHVLRRFLFITPSLSGAAWPGKLRIAHLLVLRARASLGRSLPFCLPPSPQVTRAIFTVLFLGRYSSFAGSSGERFR